MSTPTQTETFDRRFLAGLAVLLIVLVMGYLFCVTFVPMAQAGGKYADIAVPLLLGTVIGGLVGYFYGASKNQNAPTTPTAATPMLPQVATTALVDSNVVAATAAAEEVKAQGAP